MQIREPLLPGVHRFCTCVRHAGRKRKFARWLRRLPDSSPLARNPREFFALACESHKNRFPVSLLRVLSPTYGEVPGGLWRRQNCAENSTGGVRRRCYVLDERLPGDSSGVEYHSGLRSESGGNAAWGRKNRHILKALPNATRKPQLMSLRSRDRSSGSTRPRVMVSLFQTKIIFQTFYFM